MEYLLAARANFWPKFYVKGRDHPALPFDLASCLGGEVPNAARKEFQLPIPTRSLLETPLKRNHHRREAAVLCI